MPRRKKNGQSPARVPGGPPDGGSLGHNTGYRLPQGFDGAMANNFPSSSQLSGSDKDEIVKNMREMFSHLDPEVIHMVLSECDFKAENAMDSLLELSGAAEVAGHVPSPISGFERTAAALLSPHHFSEPRSDPDTSRPPRLPSSPASTSLLTEEMDLLVDQELETLTAQQNVEDENRSSQYLSSFPPPPLPQQALPELLQSSLQPGSRGLSVQQQAQAAGLVEHTSGASSPLNQLSTWDENSAEKQQPMLDFTHLMTETPADKPKPPLDLAASGRPSAFQVYKKQDSSQSPSDKAGVVLSKGVVGGARSKVNMQSPWNLEAPAFSPCIHGNQEPAFITPVAQTPSCWHSQHRHWLSQGPVSQAPLKPSATIPQSWAQPAAPRPPAQHSRLRLEGKVLVLLRGAPGSGKSTLARALVEHNPGGVKLSTDDYFTRSGGYRFDPAVLGEAHEWNHKRAKEAFERGANPIIIDNTNMQGWEMKPYVSQALKYGYKVLFREPDTWWKNKPRELERRTSHDVPLETIRRMLNGYERFVTVQSIMGSQMPELKQRQLSENKSSQAMSSAAPRPDLVGQSGLIQGRTKSHPQLFSSLPDVSSIDRSSEMEVVEDSAYKSTESLNFQPTGRPAESPELSDEEDDTDLRGLGSELDPQLELNPSMGDQRIPDCIVESVMNEDQHGDERPVAFSESIGQRVRRERPSRRSGFDRLEPADLVKDTHQLDSEAKEREKTKKEDADLERLGDGAGKGIPELLDFVGDWPSEASLQQRQVRRRDRRKDGNGKDEANENKTKEHKGPKLVEMQKLLDLIQTGVAPIQTGSSSSSSVSPSSGEELDKEEQTEGRFEASHGSRSNSEGREQNTNIVNTIRGELPDCVLDWKAADSGKVRESKTDNSDQLKSENEASCTAGGNNDAYEFGRETASVDFNATNQTIPLSALTDDSQAGGHTIEGEVGTELDAGDTDVDTNNCSEARVEADGSRISEGCLSPVVEGSLETESGAFSGGSQERKQRQGRRSGKQCKLALTFTQNCPAALLNSLECPIATTQIINSTENNTNTDVEPNQNPNCTTCANPNFDVLTDSKSEARLQPPSPLLLVDTGCSTQTEPQDFAVLWRLNRQGSPGDSGVTIGGHRSDIRVLSGDTSRFVPGLYSDASAAAAVQPSGHREVPYRVVHEKGTQVEEKDLGANRDRLESLQILRRHFKKVNFDILEDLYEKCHHDLEWTTNLLLDSGERFFRDEDGEEEEEEEEDISARGEDDQSKSDQCGKSVESRLCPDVLDEHHHGDRPQGETALLEEGTQQSTFGTVSVSDECSNDADVQRFEVRNDPDTTSLSEKSQAEVILPQAANEGERHGVTQHNATSEAQLEGGARGGSQDDGVIIEDSRDEREEEIASMYEAQLLQAGFDQKEDRPREEERDGRRLVEHRKGRHLDIQSVELKLPTEVALQLTELFGPVGVDSGTCPSDDYVVQMDLSMAKLLHQKWKETIQEKQRQAALSFHLLQESSSHWGESQVAKPGPRDRTHPGSFLISADGYASLDSHLEAYGQMPFMDHWNVSRPHVSLRDIIKEEQALQENVEKTRQSRADLDRRDGAALMKETQLFSLFPTIDRHFLQDIFRDHNYSLTQTELFLRSLLDEEPVKTVVAPEAPRSNHLRAASKEREKRQKPLESSLPSYQDTEDPEYQDFRAEASLQRSRQLESFSKAAEAFKQGRKEVASFYAQQGHLHGRRMQEANHRAAAQIFERVNSSLLPKNILDLHGLHVNEALEHLAQVLQNKTTECEQGLCRPQLSVITGRGNHSQGGVARIRPAVLDYLTNKHYRFSEPKPGLVLVSLK